MKTWGEMGKDEILEAILDGKEVEVYCVGDLKIYSLTEEQLQSNLQSYEDKMVKLWEVFYA